jgi:hypothetical protein
MATTNDSVLALATLAADWFANAAAKYTVPIDAANIKSYSTTPSESSASPNWCIFRVLHTRPDSEVFDHTDLPGRVAITLFSGLAESEASREAAERWLNDAEEMLVEQLAEIGPTANWFEIAIIGQPRRDAHRMFHGKYRTSDIVIEIDKK